MKKKYNINEDLTKNEVNSLISQKLNSEMSSKEFEKKIKEITSNVLNDFFKTLYQKNNFWKNSIK